MATGVLVALRALLDVPGVVDPEAARSAIAKIESAAGHAGHGVEGTAVDEQAPAESEAAAAVRTAVRTDKALAIDYYSASHDTLSSRVIDPIRVVLIADTSYLEAWCRSAEGVRLWARAGMHMLRGEGVALAAEPELAALAGEGPVEPVDDGAVEDGLGAAIEAMPVDLRQGAFAKRRPCSSK